jgi:hypothetical protein
MNIKDLTKAKYKITASASQDILPAIEYWSCF